MHHFPRIKHYRFQVSLDRTLSRGDWFLSVFNDDPSSKTRTLRAVIGERAWSNQPSSKKHEVKKESIVPAMLCPGACHGRGECQKGGVCKCQPQFSGEDCSISELMD